MQLNRMTKFNMRNYLNFKNEKSGSCTDLFINEIEMKPKALFSIFLFVIETGYLH